jgi:hypothetical protein
MSEEHNADESGMDNKTNSINRRRFVKSLGIAGGTAAFGTLSSTTVSALSRERDVEVITGSRTSDIIQKIENDKEVVKIIQFLSEKGWRPQYNDGKYGIVTSEDGERFNIAVVPFHASRENNDVSSILRWSESSDENTVATILNQGDSVGDDRRDVKERTVWVENGNVKSKTEIYSLPITGSSEDVSINKPIGPGLGGGGGSCENSYMNTVSSGTCRA